MPHEYGRGITYEKLNWRIKLNTMRSDITFLDTSEAESAFAAHSHYTCIHYFNLNYISIYKIYFTTIGVQNLNTSKHYTAHDSNMIVVCHVRRMSMVFY